MVAIILLAHRYGTSMSWIIDPEFNPRWCLRLFRRPTWRVTFPQLFDGPVQLFLSVDECHQLTPARQMSQVEQSRVFGTTRIHIRMCPLDQGAIKHGAVGLRIL